MCIKDIPVHSSPMINDAKREQYSIEFQSKHTHTHTHTHTLLEETRALSTEVEAERCSRRKRGLRRSKETRLAECSVHKRGVDARQERPVQASEGSAADVGPGLGPRCQRGARWQCGAVRPGLGPQPARCKVACRTWTWLWRSGAQTRDGGGKQQPRWGAAAQQQQCTRTMGATWPAAGGSASRQCGGGGKRGRRGVAPPSHRGGGA